MSEEHLFAAQTFPEIYENVLVNPLFQPFASVLIERLDPAAGDSLVDIACGTGIVARLARERLGPDARIVGVDGAPAMLAVARTVDATIDWREGQAAALPVPKGEHYSLVTCHQGLQFFRDKVAAVTEMRRVLTPGGRLAIGVWQSVEYLPAVRDLNAVAEQHVGRINDTRHAFGRPEALEALLVESGFSDVRVSTTAHDVRFPDGSLFARLNAMAVIGMSEGGARLSEAERRETAGRIAADSAAVIDRYSKDGAFVAPMSSNVAIARA